MKPLNQRALSVAVIIVVGLVALGVATMKAKPVSAMSAPPVRTSPAPDPPPQPILVHIPTPITARDIEAIYKATEPEPETKWSYWPHYKLGELLIANGFEAAARERFNKAISLHPTDHVLKDLIAHQLNNYRKPK